MFGITSLPTFITAGILLNISPGADTIFIVGRSISYGRKAGIYSALGIATGCFVHILCAAYGLSLIISKSVFAYDVIKYLGAIYLCYLGILMLIKKEVQFNIESHDSNFNLKKIFISGILTNVLNPKVAIFFLMFLPQFVLPSHSNNAVPFLILGIIFNITGTIWNLLLSIFASGFSSKLKANVFIANLINKFIGVIFISIGVKLAFTSRK